MMKLGVGALYKDLGRVRIWGYSPLGAHPPKRGYGSELERPMYRVVTTAPSANEKVPKRS